MRALVLLSCAGLLACAQEDGLAGPGSELRSGDAGATDFWNLRLEDPANGAVQLSDDDGPNPPDIIIWDIDGDEDTSDVYEGPAFGGALVLSTVDNQIYDADGQPQCTATFEDGLYKLREGLDGPVIYTATAGRYVFAGDVPGGLPSPGTPAWQTLIYTQLEYEFYQDHVYDGPHWHPDAEAIATASVDLQRANPMRKLLIAALQGGICGSPGEPTLPPPG